MISPTNQPKADPTLRRVLTLWPLMLYGLGVIVGAGVYVAIGAVVERSEGAAPLSFLIAGIAAALTGLCYAELAARFPEAAGAASYVRHAFGTKHIGLIVGLGTAASIAVAAASIAHGAASYLTVLVPLPPTLLSAGLVLSFTALALVGVRTSVGLAAAIGALEVGGLVVATIVGFGTAPDLNPRLLLPQGAGALQGVVAGAFIAFFAFVGFETLANMAEEVKEPSRTLPRGILGAIAVSVILYVAVVSATVLSGRSSSNPLLGLFEGHAASAFAFVGFLSVANGVLIQIITLSRLFYGMGRNQQLPASLALVSPRTGTPIVATFTAGAVVLVGTLTMSFEGLLVWANALTLLVFVAVDLALWRVKQGEFEQRAGFTAPAWVPVAAAVVSIGLIVGEFAR